MIAEHDPQFYDFVRDDALPNEGYTDFDLDTVCARVDGENLELLAPEQIAADALAAIFRWLLPETIRADSFRSIGKKALALAWVVNPELVNGMALADIAKAGKVTPAALQTYAVQAGRLFGLKNRAQRWNENKASPERAGTEEACRAHGRQAQDRSMTTNCGEPKEHGFRPSISPLEATLLLVWNEIVEARQVGRATDLDKIVEWCGDAFGAVQPKKGPHNDRTKDGGQANA